jgi:DNA-binding transcriptional MerR regulator
MQTGNHRVETGRSYVAGDLMDEGQVAAYLLITPRTLRLWRQTRGIPHIRITSKVIRYRRSDIDAWLSQRRIAIVT